MHLLLCVEKNLFLAFLADWSISLGFCSSSDHGSPDGTGRRGRTKADPREKQIDKDFMKSQTYTRDKDGTIHVQPAATAGMNR